MKAGIAAAAVAAALSLSGCGGSGGKQQAVTPTDAPESPSASAAASTSATRTPTPTPTRDGTATATATATASTGASASADDATHSVEGVWLAAQGDAKVQLVLSGGEANLTSAHLCGGGYTEKSGVAITLTCMDGDKERTRGQGVLAADGSTLTVQWAGGPTDVFTRTGLPSD